MDDEIYETNWLPDVCYDNLHVHSSSDPCFDASSCCYVAAVASCDILLDHATLLARGRALSGCDEWDMEAEGLIRFLESQLLHCDDYIRPESADGLPQNSVTEHAVGDRNVRCARCADGDLIGDIIDMAELPSDIIGDDIIFKPSDIELGFTRNADSGDTRALSALAVTSSSHTPWVTKIMCSASLPRPPEFRLKIRDMHLDIALKVET